MVLVFGGTTEGKRVAETLDALGIQYYYSTKTKVAYTGKGIPIFGAMTLEVLEIFCKTHSITHIINASHPFASQLHQTIAALPLELPLIRFQRVFAPRRGHQLVTYVESFKAAIAHFNANNYRSLLALSGVQTIVKLKPYWDTHPTWFRILDRDTSRDIAAKAGFSSSQLVFGYPQLKADEMVLFTKIAPEVVFTKESGSHGKLDEKIEAALALELPITILKRPEISNRYLCIDALEELVQIIN